MKIQRVFCVLVTALIMAGCAQQGASRNMQYVTKVAMVGFSRDSLVKNKSTRQPIEFDDTIETDGIVAFATEQIGNQRWDKVLLGAPFENNGIKGNGRFRLSSIFFNLTSGWVYIYGQGPISVTDRVSAGADGSVILVQIDTIADVHRVYMLGGTTATVTNLQIANDEKTLIPGQYVEAPQNGALGPVQEIAANVPIKVFSEKVTEKADIFFP